MEFKISSTDFLKEKNEILIRRKALLKEIKDKGIQVRLNLVAPEHRQVKD